MFAEVPESLVVCIHGLVAVSLYWVDAVLHGVPCKNQQVKNLFAHITKNVIHHVKLQLQSIFSMMIVHFVVGKLC